MQLALLFVVAAVVVHRYCPHLVVQVVSFYYFFSLVQVEEGLLELVKTQMVHRFLVQVEDCGLLGLA